MVAWCYYMVHSGQLETEIMKQRAHKEYLWDGCWVHGPIEMWLIALLPPHKHQPQGVINAAGLFINHLLSKNGPIHFSEEIILNSISEITDDSICNLSVGSR